jgi:hypothetical protein
MSGERASEEKKVFVLKKSDAVKSDILMPLWRWMCPICYRQVVTHSLEKTIAAAKLHLERSHKYEVKVIEE